MAPCAGESVHTSPVSPAPASRLGGGRLRVALVRDLLFVSKCPEPAEPSGPLPSLLCLSADWHADALQVGLWPPLPPQPSSGHVHSGLVRGITAEARGRLHRSHLAPAPSSCSPLPSARRHMQRLRTARSWGPARHLHANVFKAISALSVIPAASGINIDAVEKPQWQAGRQAARESCGLCVAINKSAKHRPPGACREAALLSSSLPQHAVGCGACGRGGTKDTALQGPGMEVLAAGSAVP